jgi:hypothetical protein
MVVFLFMPEGPALPVNNVTFGRESGRVDRCFMKNWLGWYAQLEFWPQKSFWITQKTCFQTAFAIHMANLYQNLDA